ncbi:HWE histidine kinase domain-containing protein [Xanthobacter sp. KR7-225]|uniref:HWE histidine kinase domain-containing protein n=1 Tax=Xanthobacter sp. KR7-225 TaxID=3156613 RepID=UPI0032B4441E
MAEHVNLSNCDREPIHILGAVQRFGFLVALDPDWVVAHASENVAEHLGRPAADLLGTAAEDIFDHGAIHTLRNMAAMLFGPDAVERGRLDRLTPSGGAMNVAVHVSDGLFVIEGEPAPGGRGDPTSVVRAMVSRVRATPSLAGFLDEATRQVRGLTGFDRVMAYRFDADGAGEVVAEARRGGVDSFLGLNYPASDIPAQARALYLRNTFRVIADVGETPALILPRFDPGGRPLDLSLSFLRAVSPIHIEYLRNMGVAASLSISILVEGRLWGLFACHHYTPRRPTATERTAAELFGSMFSLMLESRLRAEEANYEARARGIAERLVSAIARDPGTMADAARFGSIVAEAIPSEGVAIAADGRITLSGLTPDEGQFRGIVAFLRRSAARQIFTTDRIAAHLPEATAYAAKAAGMLAIPISRAPQDYLVLFRTERLRAVRWAGNPEKPVELGPNGERLTPRRSFAEWSQLVKGAALPFTAAETRIAQSLRVALLEVVLRLSDATAEEQRKARERQTLLIAELNHRVRNILALIRGLVVQTRQNTPDPVDMMETLDLRVQALARAHDQITADPLATARLSNLVATEAGAFLGAAQDRVRLEGPDVRLAPDAFTVVALVVHELVTNAAKYGALSSGGAVSVRWRVEGDGSLRLKWRETGGPPVAAPKRRGFGSTIIERSIPHELGGTAEVRYRVSGLEVDLLVPATYVSEAEVHLAAATPRAPARQESPFKDRTVLVVEDNLIIALGCEATLRELGAKEVLLVSSVADARAHIAGHRVDLALLDFNLGRETSLPLARELKARAVPVIFTSGYGASLDLPQDQRSAPVVVKPYTADDLVRGALQAGGK